jgi:proteasome lid subunit RPN8/RPN11
MDYHLEDSQVHTAKLIDACFKHGLSNPKREMGGFFYSNELHSEFYFHPLINDQTYDPHFFVSKDSFFYEKYLQNRILALFHTHIGDDPTPSARDISIANSLILPSFILSVSSKKTHLFYPYKYTPKPLSKRLFIPYLQDCLIYVKDFLLLQFNINLQLEDINWSRKKEDNNLDMLRYINKYFNEVSYSKIQNGDLIIFKPTLSRFMHLGVYKDGLLCHHPIYTFPKKELISDEVLNQVYKVYRYKDL